MGWRDLLPANTPQERRAVQDAWLADRSRPNEVKTITFTRIERSKTYHPGRPTEKTVEIRKNIGLPASGQVTFRTGICPCSVCGHQYQWECELASDGDTPCDCCSSICS